MKTTLKLLAVVAALVLLCSGCASIGMLGVQSRAELRGEQERTWWLLLQQGRITMEDYQQLRKLQGPLTKWYE